MSPWASIALYAFLAIALGVSMLGISRLLGPKRFRKGKLDTYECGVPVMSSSRERFSVHFYLVAILFILFDLETVFLIPWTVLAEELGWNGLFAMFLFLGIVVFGLVYEWKRGALEWE